jgi:trk system potassium uptake protein TrkH
MLALMTLGMDAITVFGSVATCMNNMGPGPGETAANFAAVSDAEKMDLRPGHAARAVGDL